MNCEVFQEKINDFIFDRIEYSEDLEDFLSHAKECKDCMEELQLYYTIPVSYTHLQVRRLNQRRRFMLEQELKQVLDTQYGQRQRALRLNN